jgi:hypothetical protein
MQARLGTGARPASSLASMAGNSPGSFRGDAPEDFGGFDDDDDDDRAAGGMDYDPGMMSEMMGGEGADQVEVPHTYYSFVHYLTMTVQWPQGTGFPRLSSAVTSTVDHPLGSPSLCFP